MSHKNNNTNNYSHNDFFKLFIVIKPFKNVLHKII